MDSGLQRWCAGEYVMGSRTGENRPDVLKWEVVVTALDLGLQAYRTTASRDRFIDALAEVGRARELEARCVRAEAERELALEAMREWKGRALILARQVKDMGEAGVTGPGKRETPA